MLRLIIAALVSVIVFTACSQETSKENALSQMSDKELQTAIQKEKAVAERLLLHAMAAYQAGRVTKAEKLTRRAAEQGFAPAQYFRKY